MANRRTILVKIDRWRIWLCHCRQTIIENQKKENCILVFIGYVSSKFVSLSPVLENRFSNLVDRWPQTVSTSNLSQRNHWSMWESDRRWRRSFLSLFSRDLFYADPSCWWKHFFTCISSIERRKKKDQNACQSNWFRVNDDWLKKRLSFFVFLSFQSIDVFCWMRPKCNSMCEAVLGLVSESSTYRERERNSRSLIIDFDILFFVICPQICSYLSSERFIEIPEWMSSHLLHCWLDVEQMQVIIP